MSYLAAYIGLIFLRFSKVRGLYIAILIFLFFYSAFRFEVGCDWAGYMNQFNYYGQMPVEFAIAQREPIWALLVILQERLGLPYPWINVIPSMIFLYGAHSIARRQPNPLAFLVLLFPILIINMPMSGIRQATAIGFFCIALLAFLEKHTTKFVIFIVLAAGFHSSAMIFLLLTPLVGGNYTQKRIVLAALLAIPGIAIILSSESAELAASRYLDSGVDAAGAAFRVGLLVITGLFYFLFLNKKWKNKYSHDHKIASIGALMMLLLASLVPLSTVIADRIGYYLIPIQTMIFVRAPFLVQPPNRKITMLAPYLGLLIVFSVWTSFSYHFQTCYLPYQTWLFGFPEQTKFIY